MSTTVQQCVEYALDRAALGGQIDLINVPAAIGLAANEEKRAYITAARLDPEYFGTSGDTSARANHDSSWNLDVTPGGVAAVSRVYAKTLVGTVSGVVAGTKINLVDSRWPDVDLTPRAYLRGRKLIGHGDELGAGDSAMVSVLTVWYSPLPTAPTTLTSTLTLPDEWRDLVILPLAKMFALRDHQPESAVAFDAEFKGLMQTFAEAVLSYGHGVRRPLQSVPAIPLGK